MLIVDQGSRLQGFCGGADEGRAQSKVWGDVSCVQGSLFVLSGLQVSWSVPLLSWVGHFRQPPSGLYEMANGL